jgi:purine nucleoside transport protein
MVGIVIIGAVAFALSKDRKAINWLSVGISTSFNLLLAAFLLLSPIGHTGIKVAADGFAWLVNIAYSGIGMVFGDWIPEASGGTGAGSSMMMFVSALMPMLLIIPLFDILTYLRVLPFIIKWIGKGVSFVLRRPVFESFYAVEMMFMGNTEALFVSRFQLTRLSEQRNLTVAMMSMSSVSAAIIGAYISMVPGEFVIAAIPLNIVSASIITSLLNPVTIDKNEDKVYDLHANKTTTETANDVAKRPPFMTFLGDSILAAGRMVLIVTAMVVSFVGLANLVNALLGLFGQSWLSLQSILGVVLFPFAILTGVNPSEAFELAQLMGLKLVTNEFVVMSQVSSTISEYSRHFTAVLVVFLTSFANISTIGMVLGTFKGFSNDSTNNYLGKNAPHLLLSGILVSLLSAAVAGLFAW